jgi:Peptidase A4 family
MKSPHPHLKETNLPGYKTFPAPPKDFNLLKASTDELHSYGFPHRPDPKSMPQAARLWLHIMSRIRKFVPPQFGEADKIVHGPDRNMRPIPTSDGQVFGASGWSGLVVTDTPPYLQVWGTWTVPSVQVPPGMNGTFYSSTWVGLGGYFKGDDNLLQAGTSQNVDPINGPSYYAWLEWFPASAVPLNNSAGPDYFPINPGQTVAVMVGLYGDGTGRGIFSMANLETGIMILPTIVPIPTINYAGKPISPSITAPSTLSAEWIVERPSTQQPNGTLAYTELADYGELNFTNAGAMYLPANSHKTEKIPATSDSNAVNVQMIADDNTTVLSEEINTMALHFTFQQTAAGL